MVQRTEFFFIFNFTINAIEGRFDDLCGIATSTSKRTFFLLKNELKTVYLVITGRKPGKKVQNLKKGPLILLIQKRSFLFHNINWLTLVWACNPQKQNWLPFLLSIRWLRETKADLRASISIQTNRTDTYWYSKIPSLLRTWRTKRKASTGLGEGRSGFQEWKDRIGTFSFKRTLLLLMDLLHWKWLRWGRKDQSTVMWWLFYLYQLS